MTDIRVPAGDCLTALRSLPDASIGVEREPTYLPLIAARLGLDAATFDRVAELDPIPAPVLTLVPDPAPEPVHLEDMTMALENADAGAPRNPAGRRRDDFEDFPRDGHKRPKIIRAVLNEATGAWEVPRDEHGNLIKELVAFTRASTLGGAIEYQGGLHRWKSAVVAWGVARSRTLGKRARAVAGYSTRADKDELYEIIDKAQAFAESDQAANHGNALHSIFQRIAEGETVDELVAAGSIDEDDEPACRAFADAITRFEVLFCERRVVCDEAQAAGKYDIIVTVRRPMAITDKAGSVIGVVLPGDRIAVDNKTSSSADYFGEKFTVQLWIYAHGRDYDQETGERTEVGVRKDFALILHVPSGTDAETASATWHWVDLRIGDTLVKTARDVLEGRKLGKAAITVADLDAEIPEEMLQAEIDRREEMLPYWSPSDVAALNRAEQQAGNACCDTWHPAGTTCPDSYLAPAEAQFTARMATDAGREQDESERRVEAEQAPTEHARELVREELAHLAGKTVGEAMDAEPAPGGILDAVAGYVAENRDNLARRLQDAAKANAAIPDAERARAYIISKIGTAATPEALTKLRDYSRAKGFWPKGDAELNGLARARAAELRAMSA